MRTKLSNIPCNILASSFPSLFENATENSPFSSPWLLPFSFFFLLWDRTRNDFLIDLEIHRSETWKIKLHNIHKHAHIYLYIPIKPFYGFTMILNYLVRIDTRWDHCWRLCRPSPKYKWNCKSTFNHLVVYLVRKYIFGYM